MAYSLTPTYGTRDFTTFNFSFADFALAQYSPFQLSIKRNQLSLDPVFADQFPTRLKANSSVDVPVTVAIVGKHLARRRQLVRW